MKEIRPIGVEHLTPGASMNIRSGCGLASLGLGIYTVYTSISYRYAGFYLSGNQVRYGQISNMLSTAGVSGMVQIPMSSLFGTRTDYESVVFGFRYKPGNILGVLTFGLRTTMATTDASTGPDHILFQIGQGMPEGYYEIVIIPYGKTGAGAFVYRDGEKIATVTLNSNYPPAYLKDRCFAFGRADSVVMSNGVALDYIFSLEDIYVAWSNVPGEDVRQGPVKLKRIPYAEVLPGDWSSVGGTPLEVLNTVARDYTTATKYLTSDPNNTLVKCKLDLTGIRATDKILAVGATTSTWRDSGTMGNVGFKWKHTDGETVNTVYTPQSGFTAGLLDASPPILYTTPGGAELTKDSLAALELVVTPSA